LAAVAGGGKFANGAVTTAYGYLLNSAGGKGEDDDGRPPKGEVRIPTPDRLRAMKS